MAIQKHTPGPLVMREWNDHAERGELVISLRHVSPGRDGGEFCDIRALHITSEAQEIARGNARLMSAAPDLLAACKGATRLQLLRSQRGEEYARLKDRYRLTAESIKLSEDTIVKIAAEERKIENALRDAIVKAEGV